MWGLLAQRSRIRWRRYVGSRGIKRWGVGVESTWIAGAQSWELDQNREIQVIMITMEMIAAPYLVEEGWGRSSRVEVRQGTSH